MSYIFDNCICFHHHHHFFIFLLWTAPSYLQFFCGSFYYFPFSLRPIKSSLPRDCGILCLTCAIQDCATFLFHKQSMTPSRTASIHHWHCLSVISRTMAAVTSFPFFHRCFSRCRLSTRPWKLSGDLWTPRSSRNQARYPPLLVRGDFRLRVGGVERPGTARRPLHPELQLRRWDRHL